MSDTGILTDGQQGSVFLVVVVLLLTLVMLSGRSILGTVVSESGIAQNLHLHKMAFYEAEGGAQIGIEILEDNIYHQGRRDGDRVEGITIDDGDFYLASALPADTPPDRFNRVAHFPESDTTPPFTRIMIGRFASRSSGGAIQMLNGYGSLGRGAAAGGTWTVYNIRSQHVGRRGSESIVDLLYRHVP